MQGLDQRFQMGYVHIALPNWKSDLKESKESVCIRLNFKANAFENGLFSGSFLRRQLMIANYRVKKLVRKSQ